MTILFLIDRYPGFGGIETVTTVLANFFLKQNYNIAILSYKQENIEVLEKLNSDILLFNFPNKQHKISSENETYLKHIITKIKPDFIINQESYSELYKLLNTVKNEISCKIITVEHNTPVARYKMLLNYLENEKLALNLKSILKKLGHPFLLWKSLSQERAYHQNIYNLSDDYILLSNKYISILKKIAKLKSIEKIHVIENPITVTPSEINIENKEKTVLYVGRLEYNHKRVDRLLKIWKNVVIETPEWKLVIVGDGPERNNLENYVTKNQIANVTFEGSQTNVEKYYSNASILCMTSNVEGFPLVLAEAMAFGCVPILYNSFESASDIIVDKSNGRLIEPFNENKFKDILIEMIQNTDQRGIMAHKAIESCSRFSLDKIGQKWEELLKSSL